jgi:hypothetical protein
MKETIGTLFAILFAIIIAATLAGMPGCAAHEDTAEADLPYACEQGDPVEPSPGKCLRITGEFRLGGMSRGACHDVWDVLHEATISTPMVASGNYEMKDVVCK